MIQWQPREVEEALVKAMRNDYVIGAYNTGGHWVTVIIAMKFNVVWYLDSAQLVPPRKFSDVSHVVNW